MNGGVSQPDTFDYKPELEKGHGKPFDPGTVEKPEGVTSTPGNLMKSPFPFRQHGQCWQRVSSDVPAPRDASGSLMFPWRSRPSPTSIVR